MTSILKPETIFIYGPPGSGKSSIGRRLAEDLALKFWDLDRVIESDSDETVAEIFAQHGELEFRQREKAALEKILADGSGVIALGGGALLDPHSRTLAEARGKAVCLRAPLDVLLARLSTSGETRPLISGDERARLEELLAVREEHYASFPIQIETFGLTPEEISWRIQVELGVYHVRGMGQGYDVRVGVEMLEMLGVAMADRGLHGPVSVVSDENVAPLYAERVMLGLEHAGLEAHLSVIPVGESFKNIETITSLWEDFTRARLERGSCVVALGGGVVGDLAGFAAAAYLRGVDWVAVPTSLLAMVDASLGGKTGFDLPSGKNLVGAFHPPRLVWADVDTLQTLPEVELRVGMAEVVKHGVISDPELFALCAQDWGEVKCELELVVRRAMAVKVKVIQMDPYEKGIRAALNLGHTLGHALEQASGYQIRHGEAVAIGMVAAARLSERLEMGREGLADDIAAVLHGLGLPTDIPNNLAQAKILEGMGVDKKRSGGAIRFVLPEGIGEVMTGVTIDDPAMILLRGL